MKPIRITRHARNRMRWHQIDDDLIDRAVHAADWEESIVFGRVNAWIAVGARFLRVTYRQEIDRVVVITAVFKRQRPRERGER